MAQQTGLASEPPSSEADSTPESLSEAETVEAAVSASQAPGLRPRAARTVRVAVRRRGQAARALRSAHAVSPVDLEEAKQESSDLGEVLARDTGVTVQRSGGLGSRGAFTLAGLGGQRLRFFLDGVPLDLMGFVSGVQNVPVNLIERVEVYQGVVPTHFGADALGGAVQLVSDWNVRRNKLGVSYQQGSFGTLRASASGRYVHKPSGLFVNGAAFYDQADNDYDVDVSVYDELGRTQNVTLPRFHDGYQGQGGRVGVGVKGRSWADRLVLTGFASGFDKEVQNGATMDRPYGEVTFKRFTYGTNVKYDLRIEDTRISTTFGYAYLAARLRDRSSCLYNWYGGCSPRNVTGEIAGSALSTDQDTDTFYLRSEITQQLIEDHSVSLSLAPTYSKRSGENRRRVAGYDPLSRPRRLFSGVAGLALRSLFWLGRLENVLFVKGYGFDSRSDSLLATGEWEDMSQKLFRLGGGDSLRLELSQGLYAKASYEYALRAPSTDELFGDGMLILDNLALAPETSHNANLGFHVEELQTEIGSFRAAVEGFARWSDNMITLLTDSDYLRYYNVYETRGVGVDTSLGWTVPDSDWLALEGRLTYQDIRNTSRSGEFAGQDGDRIPSLPYLLANGSVRLRAHGLLVDSDAVDLIFRSRFVHSFYRGWASLASSAASRLVVDDQWSHAVLLTYSVATPGTGSALHVTFEGQNITDAKLYDFYGVQRPGRAFFSKVTFEL